MSSPVKVKCRLEIVNCRWQQFPVTYEVQYKPVGDGAHAMWKILPESLYSLEAAQGRVEQHCRDNNGEYKYQLLEVHRKLLQTAQVVEIKEKGTEARE